MTARPLEYPCSLSPDVMHYSSTSHDSVISLANCAIYAHSDSKTICVSNPHIELALEASIVLLGRAVSENSQSSYSWRVFELGRVISLMAARSLDYHSRLICVGFVSININVCGVVRKTNDFPFFPQRVLHVSNFTVQ